ncbi:hypothetical protein [Streptomyces sp. JV180]|nr:hypothetical protein [Streptomyces sp. JV180]MBD3550073.1 hypothetical protein [Streptomyces sp. JV180]
MPTLVHMLARRPLTSAAVAELVALPAAPPVADDEDALTAWIAEHVDW